MIVAAREGVKPECAEQRHQNQRIARIRVDMTLSVRERLQLLHAIVKSLQEDEAVEDMPRLTKAQLRELERRRRAYLRNPSAARTWDEVQASMRKREGPFASLPKRKRT